MKQNTKNGILNVSAVLLKAKTGIESHSEVEDYIEVFSEPEE